jgi:hypothetical protein
VREHVDGDRTENAQWGLQLFLVLCVAAGFFCQDFICNYPNKNATFSVLPSF